MVIITRTTSRKATARLSGSHIVPQIPTFLQPTFRGDLYKNNQQLQGTTSNDRNVSQVRREPIKVSISQHHF